MAEDPLSKLSLFVLREGATPEFRETGTATLISPGLALTALHVLCDTGPQAIVPATRDLRRFWLRLDEPGRRGLAGALFEARLVWPPPGAPAHATGDCDLALLALDNRLIPNEADRFPSRQASAFAEAAGRLRESFGRLTLGQTWDRDAPAPQWRFIGYPKVAAKLSAEALAEFGQADAQGLATPREATLASLAPSVAGYILARSPSLFVSEAERIGASVAGDNPLGGSSGAAVYRLAVSGGVERAYVVGVVSRAEPAENNGEDRLYVSPLPPRDSRSASAKAFWRLVEGDAVVLRGAKQIAKERLMFLDRTGEVNHYFTGFAHPAEGENVRAYVFGFACTSRDLQEYMFLRLQAESVAPRRADAARLFDLECLAAQERIFGLGEIDGDNAWPRAVEEIARQIGADPQAEPADPYSFQHVLSSCAKPRVLQFVVSLDEAIDPRGGSTPWVRATLDRLIAAVSQWAEPDVVRPDGEREFTARNPIVALIAFVYNNLGAPFTADTYRFVQGMTGPAQRLFDEELVKPAGVRCVFFGRSLGVIRYEDFDAWCRAEIDPSPAATYAAEIAVKVGPWFQAVGDACRKADIKSAIEQMR